MKQMEMFTSSKLSPLQQEQLKKIVALLEGMHCTYVIKTPDKMVLSNREEKAKDKKPRNLQYPFGTMVNYIKPFISHLKEGEVAMVPFGEFPPEHLHRNVCTTAISLWGVRQYVAVIRDNGVEIMRGGI